MSGVVDGVHGLSHRPEQEHVQHLLHRVRGDLLQVRRELLRIEGVCRLELHPELTAQGGEAIELGLVRRPVEAEDRRDVALDQVTSAGLVGEQHHLFDEVIRL